MRLTGSDEGCGFWRVISYHPFYRVRNQMLFIFGILTPRVGRDPLIPTIPDGMEWMMILSWMSAIKWVLSLCCCHLVPSYAHCDA